MDSTGTRPRRARASLALIAVLSTTFVGGMVALAATARAAVVVDSIAELVDALEAAQPGTRIEVAAGTYDAASSIPINGLAGTASAPITIVAAQTGLAEITGAAGFSIAASSHIVIEGFRFTHRETIRVPIDSHHIRFTANVFQLDAADGQHWLNIDGDDVEVDRNTFRNRSNIGIFLSISGPSDGMAQRTRIHHNRFADHTFSGANGGESIRIGVSSRQSYSAHTLVEHNVFERANGDPEAISVKSSDNVIRYNTIRDSRGGIVLRHGNRNRVEANVLRGGGAEIRIYGNDHVVVNNLVARSTGRGVVIGSGTVVDDTSSTGNDRPDRVLVAFNTIVDNDGGITGEGNRPLAPHDCIVANNVVVGASGDLVDMPMGAVDFRWEGNILHGGAAGDIPSDGYRMVDPELVDDGDGVFRLASGSPAVDAAVGSYPNVALDIDRAPRSGAKDVGADELGSTTVQRFEAEDATISAGTVDSNHAGFSGTGFANTANETGVYVEWSVSAPTAAMAGVAVRYANGSAADRPMSLTVNGAPVDTISFPVTGAWANWQTRALNVSLRAGANTVRLSATTANGGPNLDYLDVELDANPPSETLLSRGKPAIASSTESPELTADKAFDGDNATRWASAEGVDPQWIRVDLGTDATVTRVRLTWEVAYARSYRIETSTDGTGWTVVSTTTDGDGGTDDITLPAVTTRYVRIYGTERGTPYGYSLWEMEIFGTLP